MNESTLSYIKGARSAKTVLKDSIKEGITFSAELIILSILLLVYSGIASTLTIGMISSAIILLVVTLITRFIFVNKVDNFYSEHSDDTVTECKNAEYVDDSMNILRMGTYTAIINIITVTISLITLFIMVISMIG